MRASKSNDCQVGSLVLISVVHPPEILLSAKSMVYPYHVVARIEELEIGVIL